MNIHKGVLVLSVKLRNFTLKLPLEAATSMGPMLTLVIKDESCNGYINGIAPIAGTRFQNLTIHYQMYRSTYKVWLDHSSARHGELIEDELLGKGNPFPHIQLPQGNTATHASQLTLSFQITQLGFLSVVWKPKKK